MCKDNISSAGIKRLPIYLSVLKTLLAEGEVYVSAKKIAELINANASVVKNDLSQVISTEGKPKVGYSINGLIQDIEKFLGYNTFDMVIVGVGKLGAALLEYEGFSEYGFKIVAGFDIDENKIGTKIKGKKIYELSKFQEKMLKLQAKIGIITTSAESAQSVANLMVENGVTAIWNFTNSHLVVPKHILVKNENLATALLVLAKQIKTN